MASVTIRDELMVISLLSWNAKGLFPSLLQILLFCWSKSADHILTFFQAVGNISRQQHIQGVFLHFFFSSFWSSHFLLGKKQRQIYFIGNGQGQDTSSGKATLSKSFLPPFLLKERICYRNGHLFWRDLDCSINQKKKEITKVFSLVKMVEKPTKSILSPENVIC